MCVRLCDGYYWPMKRGGTNNSLMTDSQKCETQCSSKAQLFVLRSSTDNIAGMRNLSGKPYSKLENAFSYRKTFNPSCRCNAEPWSERARLRHKRYGAVGKERKELAIRAIRLDLRSTLMPDADAVIAVSAKMSDGERYWDPILPVRKPAVEISALQTSSASRDSTVQTVGALVSTSAAGHWSGSADVAHSRVGNADGGSMFQSRPAMGRHHDVRVLNFGDLPFASKSRSVRSLRAPIQSVMSRTSQTRILSLPTGHQLRSSLH